MPTIEVSEECLEKLKEQFGSELKEKDYNALDDIIGESWLFRTVTYFALGKIEKRLGRFLLLKKASWVGDTGRFYNALKDGTLGEVEPVGTMLLNLDSVVDAFPWKHSLPDKQK